MPAVRGALRATRARHSQLIESHPADALKIRFTTDIGLPSLFTIVFVIGTGVFFRVFIAGKIEEEARRRS